MALDVEILAIDNIESAKSTMAGIGVTARGQEIMAEKMVFRVVRLRDIDTRAANILKQTMLSNGGEAAVSAATVNLSAEKTDVILAENSQAGCQASGGTAMGVKVCCYKIV